MRNLIVNIFMRSASLLSSLLLVVGVTTALSPTEQGIYYLIQSLGALSFFFDLGIGFVLSNMAGNAASVIVNTDGTARINDRLAALANFGIVWLLLSAVLYIFGVGAVGYHQLMKAASINWDEKILWMLFIFGTAGNFTLSAILSYFDGLGFSNKTYIIRFIQSMSNGAIFLVIIFLIKNPFSIGLSVLASVVISTVYMFYLFRDYIVTIKRHEVVKKINWLKEIFPFQWRIAISWITGYFFFQSPTLFVASSGLIEEAGQFGLSMQIFLALISLAQVYLIFCISPWSAKHASKPRQSIFRDFIKSISITNFIVIFMSFSLISLQYLTRDFDISSRLLPIHLNIKLTIGTIGFQIFICGNFYFRAQIKESLWFISMIGAAAMIFGLLNLKADTDIAMVCDLFMVIGLLLGVLTLLQVAFNEHVLGKVSTERV